jgi:hypothetical protein
MAWLPASREKDYGVRRFVMKRYLLTIILCLLSMAGIGTYYVYGSEDHLPNFKLFTLEGNAEEAAVIDLSGNYGGRMRSEFVTVSLEGSDYTSRQSLYSRNIPNVNAWYNQDPDLKKLLRDHRDFMRGKRPSGSFFMDNEWVVYADAFVKNQDQAIPEYTLKLELLNQTSGKVNHFAQPVAQGNPYSYINVVDVQLVDNLIHVLVRQSLDANRMTPKISRLMDEYHDYVFDLNSGNLVKDIELQSAISAGEKESVEYRSYMIANDNQSAPGKYAVLVVRKEQVTYGDNGSEKREPLSEQLYAYSYMTSKLTALPDSLTQAKTDTMYSLNGNLLYLMENNHQTVALSQFDLNSGNDVKKVPAITAHQLGGDQIDVTIIKNNRAYFLLHEKGIPMAAVIDTNGTLLYKGEVTIEGPASGSPEQMKQLRLINMNLK